MADFPILTDTDVDVLAGAEVSVDSVRDQLADLVRGIGPLMDDTTPTGPLHLESLEIGLTLTAEGKVAFLAKAGLEASVVLTFSRRSSNG